MTSSIQNGYQNLKVFFGDLHNHCDVSYAHGSLSDAIKNARMQLDFVSITVHAAWPDLPLDDPNLSYLVEYHQKGFSRASQNWPAYLEMMEAQNQDGHFITFPSYEWHSIEYGDYCVYFKNCLDTPIIKAIDLPALRQAASRLKQPMILIPHHIGYKVGSRGINWPAFTDQISPVVEIFSFHGLSESSEGPYPYLHSMGPRHEQGSAQYGWGLGKIFGVIGSSDHHNAFPGSYGYGRLGVWAQGLTRDDIWDSISKRRTYALTGDRIELAFSLNNLPMGSICPPAEERRIEVDVRGSSSIDYIEVLHNNRLIHRENVIPQEADHGVFKVYVELGWGEGFKHTTWEVDLQVLNGNLLAVEPRFRGYGPTDSPKETNFAYTDWQQVEPNQVRFHTLTRPNPSLHTPATEGLSLEIEGNTQTILRSIINGQQYELSLSDLLTGSRTFYMGGFVSPAVCFHRAVPQSEFSHRFSMMHHAKTGGRDWYYVRVRQKNNQYAWSSPIWVEKPVE